METIHAVFGEQMVGLPEGMTLEDLEAKCKKAKGTEGGIRVTRTSSVGIEEPHTVSQDIHARIRDLKIPGFDSMKGVRI